MTATPVHASRRVDATPELWEQFASWCRAWCECHKALMNGLTTIRAVAAWTSVVLVVLACWLVLGYARGLVAVLGSLVAVGVYAILARTHTV